MLPVVVADARHVGATAAELVRNRLLARPSGPQVVAVRLMGRSEDEHALRDSLFLTAADDDPGPAGRF